MKDKEIEKCMHDISIAVEATKNKVRSLALALSNVRQATKDFMLRAVRLKQDRVNTESAHPRSGGTTASPDTHLDFNQFSKHIRNLNDQNGRK